MKNGTKSGRQRYRCTTCKRNFQNRKRTVRKDFIDKIWQEYVWGKQSYVQLADKYQASIPTIQNWIDNYRHPETYPYQELSARHIHLVIDAFYWKRGEGVLVFRAHGLKRCLLWFEINYETINLYLVGIHLLKTTGWQIISITIDGRRGVLQALEKCAPVQLCHFHQLATVTRYLSKKPKLQASIELKKIAQTLTDTTQERLSYHLDIWYQKHQSFLKERTHHPSGNWSYTHKGVRSCYNSLKRNLPYLFTYHKVRETPTTTNTLDGYISHLRTLHRIHRGTKLHRKRKITEELLRGKSTRNFN